MLAPSKELTKEILKINEEIAHVFIDEESSKIVIGILTGKKWSLYEINRLTIDKHEFVSLCHEWAYSKGYEIGYTSRGSHYIALYNNRFPYKTKQLNGKFEETIEACEWILRKTNELPKSY